jgi:beta-lactamase regulating signal transducer with metallopeptidase domain
MGKIFLTVLNMSFTASYVILFVILVRLMLKKAPRVISYVLWGVVAFRLIIPSSFESMFSIMPRNTNAVPIPHDIIYQQNPQINSGIEVLDSFVNNSLPAPIIGASVNPLQIYVEIGAYLWVLGIIALLVYSLVSILILKRQLKNAELIEQNIFEAKNLKTPFVLGLIRPKIYLPDRLNATERNYILLHEQTHIRRKDHIIKILAFLTLSIHWFNPLVWIAFMLMSTDMELSCDEKVLKEMNEDIKKPYANSLLSLATGRYIFNGNPLAFGEGNVKGRIKNVLNYKKPRFWVVVIAAIIAVAIGVGLLANPSVNSSMPRLITGYMVIEDDLLYVDEVEIIYREDTERIEELEKLGESITTPSGYHIYNPNTDKQTFKITKETTYTFVDYSFLFLEDGVEDRLYMTSNKEEFMLHLDESYYDSPPAQKVPFFIEVKDGQVISITEKIGFTI